VGPAADTSALSISATKPLGNGCNYVSGQSSYVTEYGVNWEYRVLDDHIAKNVQMLCSMQPIDGLDVNIYLDMAPEEAGRRRCRAATSSAVRSACMRGCTCLALTQLTGLLTLWGSSSRATSRWRTARRQVRRLAARPARPGAGASRPSETALSPPILSNWSAGCRTDEDPITRLDL
jgi:hypothetical protein